MPEPRDFGVDVDEAIVLLRVPTYMIDAHGIVRWENEAAKNIVGDVRGRHFTSVVAAEERARARGIFARNLLGPASGSDNTVVVIGSDGERVSVEVSAIPVRSGGRVIGVFGQAKDVDEREARPSPHPSLTPRQAEVLHLLEDGRSTEQIAQELHLSTETVRNHIRGVFRALGVHSRLEAVSVARRHHLAATG